MTERTILIKRGGSCRWKPRLVRDDSRILIADFRAKNKNKKESAGFASPIFLIFLFFVLALVFYLYSVNSRAAKGYQIRQVEKSISELQKENEKLIIKEVELKSLYRIEEESKNINMGNLRHVSFIEEAGPMAMR